MAEDVKLLKEQNNSLEQMRTLAESQLAAVSEQNESLKADLDRLKASIQESRNQRLMLDRQIQDLRGNTRYGLYKIGRIFSC